MKKCKMCLDWVEILCPVCGLCLGCCICDDEDNDDEDYDDENSIKKNYEKPKNAIKHQQSGVLDRCGDLDRIGDVQVVTVGCMCSVLPYT